MTAAGANMLISPAASSTTASTIVVINSAAMSNITAGAEVIDISFNLNHTVQHATGAVTTQRAFVVAAPTYGFVGASTITTAATMAIASAPIPGTNATITNSYAFWVQAGATFMADTIASSSATTGTLIVGGGIGCGGNISVTGGATSTFQIAAGVANGAVATLLGSLGPTGANTTVVGWLRILVAGTAQYIPYF